MEQIVPTWLGTIIDGGLTAILAAVIYYVGQHLMKRSDESNKFAQDMATRAMDRMEQLADKALNAQVDTATAMSALADRIGNGQKDAGAHYERTSREHAELASKVGGSIARPDKP